MPARANRPRELPDRCCEPCSTHEPDIFVCPASLTLGSPGADCAETAGCVLFGAPRPGVPGMAERSPGQKGCPGLVVWPVSGRSRCLLRSIQGMRHEPCSYPGRSGSYQTNQEPGTAEWVDVVAKQIVSAPLTPKKDARPLLETKVRSTEIKKP